jgi:peptide-methionine (S)-S-oxide reductase
MKGYVFLFILVSLVLLFLGLKQPSESIPLQLMNNNKMNNSDTLVLGGGCFWCTEAVFLQLKGVYSALPGYAGGHSLNPDYKSVCSGATGHAEVVEIVFNPAEVTLSQLLEVFFLTHDPTTLNRQGADVGTQYRSIILYKNEEQKNAAERFMDELKAESVFTAPITTQISPLGTFYLAEKEHHNFFNLNPGQGYCRAVIAPKMEKFRKTFQQLLKD